MLFCLLPPSKSINRQRLEGSSGTLFPSYFLPSRFKFHLLIFNMSGCQRRRKYIIPWETKTLMILQRTQTTYAKHLPQAIPAHSHFLFNFSEAKSETLCPTYVFFLACHVPGTEAGYQSGLKLLVHSIGTKKVAGVVCYSFPALLRPGQSGCWPD